MSDDKSYIDAVAQSLERLQIKPEDLFGYVMWLRERYSQCVEALLDIYEFSTDPQASELAYETLLPLRAIEEEEAKDEPAEA